MTKLKTFATGAGGILIALAWAQTASAAGHPAPAAPSSVEGSGPSNGAAIDSGISVHVDQLLNISATGFDSYGTESTAVGTNCTNTAVLFTDPSGGARYTYNSTTNTYTRCFKTVSGRVTQDTGKFLVAAVVRTSKV